MQTVGQEWDMCKLRNLLLLLCLLFGCGISQTHQLSIIEGSTFVIEDGKGEIRQFPFLFVKDETIVSFSQHKDEVVFPSNDGLVSSNFHNKWTKTENLNFYIASMLKKKDGTWFGLSYITQRIDDFNIKGFAWKSLDSITWIPTEVNITLPSKQLQRNANWGGFLFHRSILEMEDGSLQGLMYGNYETDATYRVIWIKSIDGLNWNVVSTVAFAPAIGVDSYSEPVAIYSNNEFLVVMRIGYNEPLYYTKSKDGIIWDKPKEIANSIGADPDLIMLKSGKLVLVAGNNEGLRLHISQDNGETWVVTYLKVETGSGYAGIREVSPNKLLLVTDDFSKTKIIGEYVDIQ